MDVLGLEFLIYDKIKFFLLIRILVCFCGIDVMIGYFYLCVGRFIRGLRGELVDYFCRLDYLVVLFSDG